MDNIKIKIKIKPGEEGTVKECACAECVACCERRPGWFLPGEAERAAVAMGLTLQDFFDRYLCVEYWSGGFPKNRDEDDEDNWDWPGDTLVLAPASSQTAPGTKASFGAAFAQGKCIFLDEGRCGLHATGFKPFECKAALGCGESHADHEAVAKAWDQPEHQAQIRALMRDSED